MKINQLTVALILSAAALHAENWPNWRGPAYNGSSPEKNVPASFSKTENVAWVAPMPGPSAATPAIWVDKVFVSSADPQSGKLWAICLDAKSGKELWKQEVATGFKQDDRSNFASPSPVTDGKHVFFFYGTTDLAAFDFAGKLIWSRNIQKDHGQLAFLWTFSTSPLLHDGRLYLQVLQRDTAVNGRGKPTGNDSYLLAMDPATGKDLWQHVRPAEAKSESLEAFSTPLPFTHNGRHEIVILGGDCITGHEAATGKELWRWGTWNPTKITHWRLVPSPVAGGGVLLACAPKNAPVYAVKAGGNGVLNQKDIAWQSFVQKTEEEATAGPSCNAPEITSDVPTPLFYDGKFYVLNGGKKKLLCIEPATGKVIWSGDLGGKVVFENSPTGADGKIFTMNQVGDVSVVQAGGSEFKLLHSTPMGDDADKALRSGIAIANGHVFIRTGGNLYCLGKK